MRRTGTGLKGIDNELVTMLPRQNLIGSLDDRSGQAWLKEPQVVVDFGCGSLDESLGPDEGRVGLHPADGKVEKRTLGLSTIECASRNLHLTE